MYRAQVRLTPNQLKYECAPLVGRRRRNVGMLNNSELVNLMNGSFSNPIKGIRYLDNLCNICDFRMGQKETGDYQ